MRNAIELMPKINVDIGFVAFATCAFCFGRAEMLFFAFAAAFFHELAHLVMIYLCGGSVEKINLMIYGAYIDLKRYPLMSYKKEFLIAVAGPAVSIVSAYVFSVLGNFFSSESLYILSGVSLMLGIVNLIPAYPLDGGRMLRCITLMITNENIADAIIAISGGICTAGVLLLCLFINFRMGFQLSMTVFCGFVSVSFLKNAVMRSGAV